MTTQEKIAVMKAYVDGKSIQHKSCNQNDWASLGGYQPTWNWETTNFRVKPDKPEPRRVPLTADDIPPVCWICNRKGVLSCGGMYLVHCVCVDGVYIPGTVGRSTIKTWSELMGMWNYSTDRKTWYLCSKEAAC